MHAVQRSRRLLCAKALGYDSTRKKLRFGLVGQSKALSAPLPKHLGHADNPFVPRKPLVALVHGTSRVDKEWPLEHWIALGRRLNDAGFGVSLPPRGRPRTGHQPGDCSRARRGLGAARRGAGCADRHLGPLRGRGGCGQRGEPYRCGAGLAPRADLQL